jgi:two-component system sensor histidine kinase/response regulator
MKRPDRILIVDDVPDNLFLMRTILEDEGYEIIAADGGQQALELVNSELPDLILLDVMMPGIDGYEVTKRLRSQSDLPFIPILLITAYDKSSASKGLDLGADEFIRKPVEADELMARVRSLLRLKHSIEERDQIERQRKDFVSRLTHDMRTPLQAADRMLGLLQDGAAGEISDDILEILQTMSRSNLNLLEMVNKLLDVYRYEAGSKTLALRPLNLAQLVKDVVAELKAIATSKNLALNAKIQPDLPETKGDRLELIRVLNNLIGNALKFTETGSVDVSLEQEGSEMVLRIADTGPGIPAADQPFLFERFTQGKHHKQGSGLGLYLTHYIIDAHGGRIELEYANPTGSCFCVRLPLAQ